MQRELVARTGVDPGRIEDVAIGCGSQNAEQGVNIARTATLLAGWGDGPGVTINRFCACGIDAAAQAAGRIRGGDLELVVAGGVNSVSRVPMFSDGGPLFCDPDTVFRRSLVPFTRPNGGTIAMGHAFGATGAILPGCVVDELERRGGRYGVAAVAGAAGLGRAVVGRAVVGRAGLVERVTS